MLGPNECERLQTEIREGRILRWPMNWAWKEAGGRWQNPWERRLWVWKRLLELWEEWALYNQGTAGDSLLTLVGLFPSQDRLLVKDLSTWGVFWRLFQKSSLHWSFLQPGLCIFTKACEFRNSWGLSAKRFAHGLELNCWSWGDATVLQEKGNC